MDDSSSYKRVLSLRDVILFGLSFMAPATVFATYGIAVMSSGGMIASGYGITLICVLFSALSYARLAKQFPSSGSCYIYIKNILGGKAGFIIGWAILLDYILSPMISALLFGIFMHAYFPGISDSVFIIVFLIAITIINISGIKIAANYNTCITVFQILFMIVFCAFSTHTLIDQHGFTSLISTTPFYDEHVSWGSLFTCIPILFFSFLGFDAITTLAEETVNPQKIIPKAIFSIVFTGGVLFVISSYFMQLIIPDSTAIADPDAAAMQIMFKAGGNLLQSLFIVLTIMGTTASAIASGSCAARILYAMGKENVLPAAIFGYLSPRFRTPVINLVIIGSIGLSALFISLTFATHLISFGVIFSLIVINFSVFRHFFVRQQQTHWIKNALLPWSGVAISFTILLALGKDAVILGLVWLLAGFMYVQFRPEKADYAALESADKL
ncbi:APC family permease [Vibrio quintilis]|uniref:Putrescine importer PuuP n=1 Tax=Vibrio quintilis TaxID=1117707 RepID=A0A1M7Z1P6_9VIBR|nr:APC family permease [Vibrio quintilis]SHO58754.1 Putrescine importer PuuP [Vibrio quintilis]